MAPPRSGAGSQPACVSCSVAFLQADGDVPRDELAAAGGGEGVEDDQATLLDLADLPTVLRDALDRDAVDLGDHGPLVDPLLVRLGDLGDVADVDPRRVLWKPELVEDLRRQVVDLDAELLLVRLDAALTFLPLGSAATVLGKVRGPVGELGGEGDLLAVAQNGQLH